MNSSEIDKLVVEMFSKILGWFSNRTGTSFDARWGLKSTSGAQFAAVQLVKPVVWFAHAVVNWRSRSVAKSAQSLCWEMETIAVSKLSRVLWRQGEKGKSSLQLCLWNLNISTSNSPEASCRLSCQISNNVLKQAQKYTNFKKKGAKVMTSLLMSSPPISISHQVFIDADMQIPEM